jgi:hypothetical protein
MNLSVDSLDYGRKIICLAYKIHIIHIYDEQLAEMIITNPLSFKLNQ